MKLSVKYHTKDCLDYLDSVKLRMGPRHQQHIGKNIIARVVHSIFIHNIQVQGRPKRWTALSPIYAKIKKQTKIDKEPMRQPRDLGVGTTPWGKMGVRTGLMFNTLGAVLRITPNMVQYGNLAGYTSEFQEGHKATDIKVDYVRQQRMLKNKKQGKAGGYKYEPRNIKYTKKASDKIVPGRPFNIINAKEQSAILFAIMEYETVPTNRKRIVIPDISPVKILAPGGRHVPLLYSKR